MKESGEVITFEGIYAPDRGQAAAVTFYTFAGVAVCVLHSWASSCVLQQQQRKLVCTRVLCSSSSSSAS